MTYSITLPETIFQYIIRAKDMYISGHFIGCILLSATVIELALADKLITIGKAAHEVVECLTLAEKTSLCYRFGLINRSDKKSIDSTRKIRNALTHANMGKLTEEAKRHYSSADEAILQIIGSLYLGDFGAAMKNDAFECLDYARSLTRRWYGEETS